MIALQEAALRGFDSRQEFDYLLVAAPPHEALAYLLVGALLGEVDPPQVVDQLQAQEQAKQALVASQRTESPRHDEAKPHAVSPWIKYVSTVGRPAPGHAVARQGRE